MSKPTLTPIQQTSVVVLTSTGSLFPRANSAADASIYPYGMYADGGSELFDPNFISGAVDQVAFTYKKLGGDVLDIELTPGNIYASYEESVLEYSYLVNIHQAKNSLGSALGMTTGTFDHDGLRTDAVSGTEGSNLELKYPRFKFTYANRVSDGIVEKLGIGGDQRIYSASIPFSVDQQDFDLQSVINGKSLTDDVDYFGKVRNKKVEIKKVYYKTPHAMWRFYGYYGGINTIGNLSTYGMYADDSTFEVIPPWHNKAQAMAYEDAIYTRNSHYSYEIKNNRLRIYPLGTSMSPESIWVEFTVEDEAYDEDGALTGVRGVNNMNTLPFANIPYASINSIGKQWIRRFALALSKETLGQVRGKFTTIPIPGNDVTLNASDLLSQAKEEQEKLREELKTVLDEMTYSKLLEKDAGDVNNSKTIMQNVPYGIYVG
tara:strand:+ start:1663 stop:2958 length:1296 start_codon:yes stop_codon:yes gene_type:complete